MFKTDKKSLEQLSFSFNERDIANFKAILMRLKKEKLLTIPSEQVDTAIEGLDKIGELKLNEQVYAFLVYDTIADRESCMGGEGVELYLRHGNSLNEFYVPHCRDFVYDVGECVDFLKENKKNKIYTGQIDKEFLGISQECDEEDPITKHILTDYQIEGFNAEGIEVVVLDRLI